MQGIVTAVYASFVLAISETSLKKSFRDFEPSIAFMFSALAGLIILLPLAFVFGGRLSNFMVVLPYAIASVILAEVFYFYALSKGQLSITVILLASYPIYTIIFSHFIDHEVVAPELWPFIALVIAGTLMSSLPSKLSASELRKSGAIIWPITAAAVAGFSDAVSKHVINQTSSFDFLIAFAVAQVPIAFIYMLLQRQKIRPVLADVVKKPGDYMHAIVGGSLSVLGMGLFWMSFNNELASVVAPIIATSGAITVLFATLFLDERMTWKNAVGIACIFIGVLGISRVVG